MFHYILNGFNCYDHDDDDDDDWLKIEARERGNNKKANKKNETKNILVFMIAPLFIIWRDRDLNIGDDSFDKC